MKFPLYCPEPKSPANQLCLQGIKHYDWLIVVEQPPSTEFLIIDGGKIGLASTRWPKEHPVFVDFVYGANAHRRHYGGGRNQLIAKAIGLNKNFSLRVLDATAGLGRDAFVLASLGATVDLFERNNAVFLMLENGLSRLSLIGDDALQAISMRMKAYHRSLLNVGETTEPTFDVVYLDPMFPSRTKSANVKKDMALFHQVVGRDDDADSLLEAALKAARYRVVVKRPKQAPRLNDQVPNLEFAGKTSRFDVYTIKSIPETKHSVSGPR